MSSSITSEPEVNTSVEPVVGLVESEEVLQQDSRYEHRSNKTKTKKTFLEGIGFHWRGLVAAVIVTLCGVSALFTPPWTAAGTWASLGFIAAGWLLLIVGTTWRFWATLYIGGKKLGGRKNFGVVSDGPYSVCRNPLYFGTACIQISAACFLQSTLFAVGLAAIALFYILATIPAEERFLREHLGETYLDYCRRVPRYWPRFSLYQSPKLIEVNVRHIWNETQRAARWLLLPIAAELIGRLRVY